MWRKHLSVFQEHLKYICNDIVKAFRVGILHYAERIQEKYDLSKHLLPDLMKSESFEADRWKVQNKSFSVHEILVSINYWIPLSMQDELEDNQEDYRHLNHEDRCVLLSTIKVKYNRKRAATQIKNITTSRAASHSDSNEFVRFPHNKK